MQTTQHTRRTVSTLERRYQSLQTAAEQMIADAGRHVAKGDDYAAAVCIKAARSLDTEATRVLRTEAPDRRMVLNALRNGGGVMTACRSVREAHPTIIEQFRSVGREVALRLATAPTSW